jgi:hypothetical protein
MPTIISGDGTITGLTSTGISAAQTVTSVPSSALPAGTVLQVVTATKTDTTSTTSTSLVDVSGLSLSITPKFATSKILVMACANNLSDGNAGGTFVGLVRNSTVLVASTAGGLTQTRQAFGSGGGGGLSSNNRKINSATINYIDSPATTSSTTYKIQLASGGSDTAYLNQWGLNSDIASVSTITVMEIAQ